MAAVMTVHFSNIDEIIDCIVESKKMGIDVLPPSINHSKAGFSLDGLSGIRYGLTAIKGVGIPAAEEVILHQPYSSLKDFMDKVHDPSIKRFKVNGKKASCPLSKKNEPILINSGAFDELEKNRYKTINEYMAIRKEKKYEPLIEQDYTRKVTLDLEKEYLGTYISDHPLKSFPFTRWNDWDDDTKSQIGGIIRKIEIKLNKNGKEFMLGTLETLEDKRRFIVHDKIFKKYKNQLVKDDKVVIVGYKNEEFDNINVTEVNTIVFVKKQQEEEKLNEVDLSMFGSDEFDPSSRA